MRGGIPLHDTLFIPGYGGAACASPELKLRIPEPFYRALGRFVLGVRRVYTELMTNTGPVSVRKFGVRRNRRRW